MKTKYLAFLLFTLFTINTLAAQRGQRQNHRKGFSIDRLEMILELSEDQKEALAQIEVDTKAKIETLRNTEYESQEDKRAALKELMQTQRQAINDVLTPEQIAQLEALKEERKEKNQQRKADRKALQEELKSYRDQNILPIMLQQRAKLESKIAEEDKATITALRVKVEARKSDRADQTNKKGRRMTGVNERNQEDREAIKALLNTYKADIKILFEEIEDKTELWKNDLKAIAAKYAPENNAERGENTRSGRRDGKRGGKKPGPGKIISTISFLLLDPGTATSSLQQQLEPAIKLSIFPNPALYASTIQYDIARASNVRIELLNDQGKVIKVLEDNYREQGTFNLSVDTSNLREGLYYISITDNNGKQTQQLVISK